MQTLTRRFFISLAAATILLSAIFASPGVAPAGELEPLYPGYPEAFELTGILDQKEQDRLVINDATLQLLPSATFNTPKGRVGATGISVGDEVGLLLTETQEIESVWLIKAGRPTASSPEGERHDLPKSKMRWENGVWKN